MRKFWTEREIIPETLSKVLFCKRFGVKLYNKSSSQAGKNFQIAIIQQETKANNLFAKQVSEISTHH